jgi:NitT/TauT family transport system substrate-binding protein
MVTTELARHRLPGARRIPRRGWWWLALLVGALALTSCGGGSAGSAGSGGGAQLLVGIPPVVELGDLYVADSQDFFAQRGLDVKIRNINGGAQLIPALQSDALQIGQSNVVSVLQAQQRKLNLKCFTGAYTSPSEPELALMVAAPHAATLTSPAGLVGKTIAVNSLGNSNQLVASAYLAKEGVDPASIHFVALAYPDMPGALAAGRVDAAITDEPFTTMAGQQGAKVLAAQPDAVLAPHPAYACWVATGSWLGEHRQQAAAFVAALMQADAYMQAHPDYLPSILPKYTSVSPQLAKSVVLPHFSTSLTEADIAPWSAAAARFAITQGPVPPGSILDLVAPAQ